MLKCSLERVSFIYSCVLLFIKYDFTRLVSYKCFQPLGGAAPSDRSASGLLEWESINDAMEALAMMNHYQMKNASRCQTSRLWPSRQGANSFHFIYDCFVLPAGPYPYTLKLCFSTVQHANWSCASIQEGEDGSIMTKFVSNTTTYLTDPGDVCIAVLFVCFFCFSLSHNVKKLNLSVQYKLFIS